MKTEQIEAMQACAIGSLAGKMTFPEVVGRLIAAGVERYHADYSRQEFTYYLPSGESLVVARPHAPHATADGFDSSGVEAAIRQIQRGQLTYAEFVRMTMAAGCVGYFVQIARRCALYFGRNGETHVERFPAAAAAHFSVEAGRSGR